MSLGIITKEAGYSLLPFRFLRFERNEILVTAETGEYLFVDDGQLDDLVNKKVDPKGSLYRDLLARHFIYEPSVHNPINEMAAQYRSRKSFIFGGPALHILVVTLRCNHTCQYCQVSRAPLGGSAHDMSAEDARHAVDRIFESPSPVLTVEFQGGEPLLAFDRIRQIVEDVLLKNEVEKRNIQFVISTTLHHLDDKILDFAKLHKIQFSTSVDGPAWLHNSNRPVPGKNSYERTLEGIRAIRAEMGLEAVSALTTLTALSLKHPESIVDEYIDLNFNSISLRPLSPYGFAKKSSQRLGYSTNEYIDFYKKALEYLITVNSQGSFLSESYTSLLLTNILTPFSSGYVDLRSPLGAALGTLVYNYDGDVYPSDEARMMLEMGENGLRLGNVKNSLSELLSSPVVEVLLSAGINESLPGCSDCAFLPYCGADPIEHFSRQGDPVGHRSFSDFCNRNASIMKHLFKLLHFGDDTSNRVLLSWLSRRSVADISVTGYRG